MNTLPVGLYCMRCQHQWLRRSLSKEPKQCPECHSVLWREPRKTVVVDGEEYVLRKIGPSVIKVSKTSPALSAAEKRKG